MQNVVQMCIFLSLFHGVQIQKGLRTTGVDERRGELAEGMQQNSAGRSGVKESKTRAG